MNVDQVPHFTYTIQLAAIRIYLVKRASVKLFFILLVELDTLAFLLHSYHCDNVTGYIKETIRRLKMKLTRRNRESVETTRLDILVSMCEIGVVVFMTAFFIPASKSLLILLIKWMFSQ